MAAVNRALRFCCLLLALAGFEAVSAAPVTGTWSLSQVEDAGGELKLHADGRYDWAVSIGQVNRSSKGRWAQAGDRITLTPDDPQNPSGFLRGVTLLPWDDRAERLYLRATFETRAANLLERCPLFRVKAQRYPPLAADLTTDWPDYAGKAEHDAIKARDRANAAIALWARTNETTPDWDASLKTASEAIAAYQKAGFY
jgi:hypothetical protein